MSVQQCLLDRKVQVEQYAGSSLTTPHLVSLQVFNSTAVKWWLDNGADTKKKNWSSGTFYDTAVMFKNKVCTADDKAIESEAEAQLAAASTNELNRKLLFQI